MGGLLAAYVKKQKWQCIFVLTAGGALLAGKPHVKYDQAKDNNSLSNGLLNAIHTVRNFNTPQPLMFSHRLERVSLYH